MSKTAFPICTPIFRPLLDTAYHLGFNQASSLYMYSTSGTVWLLHSWQRWLLKSSRSVYFRKRKLCTVWPNFLISRVMEIWLIKKTLQKHQNSLLNPKSHPEDTKGHFTKKKPQGLNKKSFIVFKISIRFIQDSQNVSSMHDVMKLEKADETLYH